MTQFAMVTPCSLLAFKVPDGDTSQPANYFWSTGDVTAGPRRHLICQFPIGRYHLMIGLLPKYKRMLL